MNSWADVTVDELRQACAAGRAITSGPLNNTYAVTLRGRPVFVRQRVVHDAEYGQTFAAERYVYGLLGPSIRVPRLLFLCEDQVRAFYAGFEFLTERPTDWTEPRLLAHLAEVLAAVHEVPAARLGNVGDATAAATSAVGPYLRAMFDGEVERAPAEVVREIGRARLKEWISQAGPLFDGEPIVLCHGDVRDANIVTDEDGRVWMVDWEAARFRVAAADFNQLRVRWLTAAQEDLVLRRYVELTGRDAGTLARQIRSLRILWHLRTLNFFLHVHHRPLEEQFHHARSAGELLSR